MDPGIDPYLAQVAARNESHRFLAASTGLIYQRQVEIIRNLLTAKALEGPSVRALDWGAGKGHITYLLRKCGYDVTSCDVASQNPDSSFGQETPILDDLGVDVVSLADPVVLPFGDSTFDLVTSFGVLEHVFNDVESVREIARVLKPEGLFFCSFLPYKFSWTQLVARQFGDNYHERLYTKARVRNLFASRGLRIERIEHAQFFPKNKWSPSETLEAIDNAICRYSPLRYFATNLIVVASRDPNIH